MSTGNRLTYPVHCISPSFACNACEHGQHTEQHVVETRNALIWAVPKSLTRITFGALKPTAADAAQLMFSIQKCC